ncbi:exonuclease domain-containing protein [Alkalihalobacillus sp. BA299]|uniref:exonuclease domain-containing protein n=1 Tax=Alkalihalobacillus sp. BA299 TaxID=2815938 RepID=UPI001ADB7BB6|nr:exonuclease domain-containing protein [Alkalihalobacillus sp. BA299]
MNFSQIAQFMKQLQGKIGSGSLASIEAQTNPHHIALLKQVQKEIQEEQILTVPFKNLNVVVVDIETTGFFPEQGDQILSIGAIKVRGEEILENQTFYSFVQYDKEISPEIKNLTGITEKEVNGAPPLSEVLVQFLEYVGHSTLVAHHANHEKNFFEFATWKLFRSNFKRRILDTSFLIRVAEPENIHTRLEDYCEACGIEVENRHHALGDAKMAAKLWSIYLKKVQMLGCNNLRDLYRCLAKLG